MVKLRLLPALCALAIGIVAAPLAAAPGVDVVSDWEISDNMTAIGFSPNPVPTENSTPGAGVFNSDLAFWGDMVVQGTYSGFRLIDVSKPSRPKEIIDWTECASPTSTTGNQGDVIIWGDLVFRSWNSPAPSAGSQCGELPVASGEEGVHVIDISNPLDPTVVGFVDTPCGSHTATGVPDLANNRFLIYSSPSAGTFLGNPDPDHPDAPFSCRGVDILQVPLADPSAASYLRFLPAGAEGAPHEDLHACHDTGVILGDVLKAACAGGNSLTIWSLDPADGGSLDDPVFVSRTPFAGVSIGHTAAFTWDGRYAIFGHEPGGGSGAQCQATNSLVNRTLYFVEAETGAIAGSYVQERPQSSLENCTWHNLNVVPLKDKRKQPRYVLVAGNYQMGIQVVDFTDVQNGEMIAYADPPTLLDPNPPTGIELGGDWSTYWYNGRIYESDITRGLLIWRLDDDRVGTFHRTTHSNPQTQEFTID